MPGSAGDDGEAVVAPESVEETGAPLDEAVSKEPAGLLDLQEPQKPELDDVDLYANEEPRLNWLRWLTTMGLQSCDNRSVDALLKDEASIEAFYNFLAAGEGQEGENRCAVFYLEDAASDFGLNSAPPAETAAATEKPEGGAAEEQAVSADSPQDAAIESPDASGESKDAPAEGEQAEAPPPAAAGSRSNPK